KVNGKGPVVVEDHCDGRESSGNGGEDTPVPIGRNGSLLPMRRLCPVGASRTRREKDVRLRAPASMPERRTTYVL
ncbi:hypothetical protein, partial [Effusibacillus lacus]